MRKIYGAAGLAAVSCAIIAWLASPRAVAQGVPTPEMQVPAIREPHHFVKLDNKYARVLDVTVAPFSGTLCHTNARAYVKVALRADSYAGQNLGAKETMHGCPHATKSDFDPSSLSASVITFRGQ